jgi:hypothetical protein
MWIDTDMHEKRKFPRFTVTAPVICFRYGRHMTMRTLDISRGGLKLEANFDLGVGEPMDLAILTDNARIQCKGIILAIEEFNHKVRVRLCFSRISDGDFKKLSNYLHTLSRGKGTPFKQWLIGGILFLLAYIAYLIIRTYLFR